ncbi:hypothetical protein DL95DRAFT_396233 [Leptodontidium sp. 2 PMI_412]|nr:hypothetical protein DL95DRAFT_396233 [Leptodontidium sp. 2 PMI_412]
MSSSLASGPKEASRNMASDLGSWHWHSQRPARRACKESMRWRLRVYEGVLGFAVSSLARRSCCWFCKLVTGVLVLPAAVSSSLLHFSMPSSSACRYFRWLGLKLTSSCSQRARERADASGLLDTWQTWRCCTSRTRP